MDSDVEFNLDGIDELDTQLKLYQMGVESFSPYASTGKVDLIIRSENGDLVRYADIKVCTGVRKGKNIVWELEIGFFMNNESFLILAVRLPDEDESFQKHHIVLESRVFLQIVKKQKMKAKDDKWVIALPFSDLQILKEKSKAKFSKPLTKSLGPFFDNWDCLLEWRSNRQPRDSQT